MKRQFQYGFTLIEILVALAILVLVFGLLFRPMMTALDIANTGQAGAAVATTSRLTLNQLTREIGEAMWVRSMYGYLDPATGSYRVPYFGRLDLIPPARVGNQVVSPLQPRTDASGDPVKVTYFVRRRDPSSPYDPIDNPRVLYRAEYATDPTYPDPDLLWLDTSGGTVRDPWPGWNVNNYAWAQWDLTGLTFPSPAVIDGVSAVSDREADVRRVRFLPTSVDNEALLPNGDYTAYTASRGLWVRPYQNDNGDWVMPGGPIRISFLSSQQPSPQRASGNLDNDYVIDVDPATGHPWVQTSTGRLVYDTTWYSLPLPSDQNGDGDLTPAEWRAGELPDRDNDGHITENDRRVFGPFGAARNEEFACGIDWETGRLLTAFSRTDVFDSPEVDGSRQTFYARIFPGTPDELVPLPYDPAAHGTDLDMSIVPGSETVTVDTTAIGGVVQTFHPLRSELAGQFIAPGPGQYHINYATGAITFAGPPPVGTVIRVSYRYRNNLPTVHDLALSSDPAQWSGRDLLRASYWTRSRINVDLTIDVPSSSSKKTLQRQTVQLKASVEVRNAPRAGEA